MNPLRRARPPWPSRVVDGVLLALTIAFIVAALGLNARLVDALVLSAEQSRTLVIYGAGMAGAGATLVLAQWLPRRWWLRFGSAVGGLILAAGVGIASWAATEQAVASTARQSTTEMRAKAYKLQLLKGELATGTVALEGLYYPRLQAAQPEVRAFFSLLGAATLLGQREPARISSLDPASSGVRVCRTVGPQGSSGGGCFAGLFSGPKAELMLAAELESWLSGDRLPMSLEGTAIGRGLADAHVPVARFADGAASAQVGREFVQAALVPAMLMMALAVAVALNGLIALAGALRLFGVRRWKRWSLIGQGLFVVVVLPFFWPSAVQNAASYESSARLVRPEIRAVMDWTLRTQPVFYSAGRPVARLWAI